MSRRPRFSGLRNQIKKQGPCDHCGIPESPMWRTGPSRKPVLCNACGSRWRLRRSLTNYVPNQTYPLLKRRSRKSDRDFCCSGNVVKIEDDVSLHSDGNQMPVELVADPNHKSSSELAIPDQPIIKMEPVVEDENPVGKESTLGVVLLEPRKLPEKEVSKALPRLLGADTSIVEAPKEETRHQRRMLEAEERSGQATLGQQHLGQHAIV